MGRQLKRRKRSDGGTEAVSAYSQGLSAVLLGQLLYGLEHLPLE